MIRALDVEDEEELRGHAEKLVQALPLRKRERLQLLREVQSVQASTPHGELLEACIATLRASYRGLEVVYSDTTDGSRISDEHLEKLEAHGLRLTLSDTYPDAIVASRRHRVVVGIEAVTSDGEFDPYRTQEAARVG